MLIPFRVLTQNISHGVFYPAWSQGLFSSHAMEKDPGTRLIVCCLEVLPLRPFTCFCLLSNTFPDFGSVGRSVGKEKKPKKNGEGVSN